MLTDSKITLKEYGISKETPLHLIFKFDNENTKLFQVSGYSVFNSNQFGTNLGATYIDKEGKCKFWYIKYPSIKEKTSSANENNKIRANPQPNESIYKTVHYNNENLNRYSFFPEIANFLLSTCLYQNAKGDSKSYRDLYKKHGIELTPNAVKRIKHGIEHAVRTANYIDIFNELHRKHRADPKPLLEDAELIKMLKIAALLHDAGRNCDIGGETEKSEKRSATLCRDILRALRKFFNSI